MGDLGEVIGDVVLGGRRLFFFVQSRSLFKVGFCRSKLNLARVRIPPFAFKLPGGFYNGDAAYALVDAHDFRPRRQGRQHQLYRETGA